MLDEEEERRRELRRVEDKQRNGRARTTLTSSPGTLNNTTTLFPSSLLRHQHHHPFRIQMAAAYYNISSFFFPNRPPDPPPPPLPPHHPGSQQAASKSTMTLDSLGESIYPWDRDKDRDKENENEEDNDHPCAAYRSKLGASSGSSLGDDLEKHKHPPSTTTSSDSSSDDIIVSTGHDVSAILPSSLSPISSSTSEPEPEPSLTPRAILLSTLIAALGASLSQIYSFKPIEITVSTVLLLLITHALGLVWVRIIPDGEKWKKSENVWWKGFGEFWSWMNGGPWGLKEHAITTLLASTASMPSSPITTFTIQKLFYDPQFYPSSAVIVLTICSTCLFGYSLLGFLRPIVVYPAESVFWTNLPNIVTIQALHRDDPRTSSRLRLFYKAMAGMAIWELLPQYIFPLLDALSLPCLISQTAPLSTRQHISRIFGGSEANEGLGLMEVSMDWQYVGSVYLSLPLVQQANAWVGFMVCWVSVVVVWYSGLWDTRKLPMLSSSLYNGDGTLYNVTAVFDTPPLNSLNITALQKEGLPVLSAGQAWSLLCGCWAIGALITHITLFWSPSIKKAYTSHRLRTNTDPHYLSLSSSYTEAPWHWYTTLMFLSFLSGLIAVILASHQENNSMGGLGVGGYMAALGVGGMVGPFVAMLVGRLGMPIGTDLLMRIVGGVVVSGKPVGNLYFSMWSQNVITSCVHLSAVLKMGQYLKLPPRTLFLTQIWATLLGAGIQYGVMSSIVSKQRAILLNIDGAGDAAGHIWTGVAKQNVNLSSVTWSLASELFNAKSRYVWIPLGLILGVVPTTVQWIIWKRHPRIFSLPLDLIYLPVIYEYAQWMTINVGAPIGTTILAGIVSQVWLRRRHPRWFKKYLYLLGGALDSGTQITVFVLSFAVWGVVGRMRGFPNWWGNPVADANNLDYCIRTVPIPAGGHST